MAAQPNGRIPVGKSQQEIWKSVTFEGAEVKMAFVAKGEARKPELTKDGRTKLVVSLKFSWLPQGEQQIKPATQIMDGSFICRAGDNDPFAGIPEGSEVIVQDMEWGAAPQDKGSGSWVFYTFSGLTAVANGSRRQVTGDQV